MTRKKATKPTTPGDGTTLASPSVFDGAFITSGRTRSDAPNVAQPPRAGNGATPSVRREALRRAAGTFARWAKGRA